MSGNIIELSNLTKTYGSFTAVDHLDLVIKKGEIFGLLGPNGAGKSTVILMMLGLTEPADGTVKVCGIDPVKLPIEVKRKVGYLPEDVGFYSDLTGMENLIYTANLNGISKHEARLRAKRLLDRVGLPNDADKKTGKYSRGMRQRLGLADVLIKSPEIIILDEPTLGIDPTGVREFLLLITRLSKEEGLTVLLSSHDLHNVQKICDRVGLFVRGKLLAEGDIKALSRKLFNSNTFIIEAGVNGLKPGDPAEQLKIVLKSIDGIVSVQIREEFFQIEGSRDVTAEIARCVINSGLELHYLNRKELALDDIYYQYFEGDKRYENQL
jgi:ABC-2 type transport system ATP-binding protein